MVLRKMDKFHGCVPTGPEVGAVMAARRQALAHATRAVTGGDPLPAAWRTGWTGHVEYLGRSRDGHLLATITVRGPGLQRPYRRKVRCVSHNTLNLDLKERWRGI